jgi:hypothetical protein
VDIKLETRSIDDAATLSLVSDARSAWSQVFQGMAPLGDWLQARVAFLIRQWIGPDWHTSHGQVFDPKSRERQTRSWDLIIHRRVPDNLDLPPPATPDGPWVLIPKGLCAAVIDTKGRYDTPRVYSEAPAFNDDNDNTTPQLDLLVPDVKPALFILATTRDPVKVMAEGTQYRLPTFALSRATDHKGDRGTASVTWKLTRSASGTLPLQDFRAYITGAVADWEARQKRRPPQ